MADADAILAIRADAIRTSTALWIDDVPPDAASRDWLRAHVEDGTMLVAEITSEGAGGTNPRVVGYACRSPLRDYDGYRWTAEDSVYLAPEAQGRGIGRALLEALVSTAEEAGMHSLVGVIEASNAASIALHARCGFVEVGRIPHAGRKFDRWLDLVIMQRLLDGAPGS